VPPEPTTADSAAECQRLARALALAERERQLLGYEIHDGLIQNLTAAALLLEAAGQQATFTAPAQQESFTRGLSLLRETIAAARQLVAGVEQVTENSGDLADELKALAHKFRTDHQLPVTFDCDSEVPSVDRATRKQLLRITQESLFNVLKHARATEVEVKLSMREGKLNLTIADNGMGFDPAETAAGRFGLASIRTRCDAIDADLVFDTAPQHGTKVVVALPLPT
jgi:signal transduction histidine kinase